MPVPFNPAHAAKRLRVLLRAGLITPHQYAVADALLWSCRSPGRDAAQVGYHRLAQLAGVARATAVAAVRRLRDLGVLAWRRTRLRVIWSLGVASRQGRNVYCLLTPATGSSCQPADRGQARKQERIERVQPPAAFLPQGRNAATAALAAIAARRRAVLGL